MITPNWSYLYYILQYECERRLNKSDGFVSTLQNEDATGNFQQDKLVRPLQNKSRQKHYAAKSGAEALYTTQRTAHGGEGVVYLILGI